MYYSCERYPVITFWCGFVAICACLYPKDALFAYYLLEQFHKQQEFNVLFI